MKMLIQQSEVYVPGLAPHSPFAHDALCIDRADLMRLPWARRWNRRSPGSAVAWLGWGRQAVLALGLDQLASDGQAHQGAHDLVLGVPRGEGGDNVVPTPVQAVAEQLEDRRRDAGYHRVRVV